MFSYQASSGDVGDMCALATDCTKTNQHSTCASQICICLPGYNKDPNSCQYTFAQRAKSFLFQ